MAESCDQTQEIARLRTEIDDLKIKLYIASGEKRELRRQNDILTQRLLCCFEIIQRAKMLMEYPQRE